MAKLLALDTSQCSIPIGALNGLTTLSQKMITAVIKSKTSEYERKVSFLVVPQISEKVPQDPIMRQLIRIPKNVKLADPNFHKVAPVDMLLGTVIALSTLCVGQINISIENNNELFLQKTLFGWVIGGSVPIANNSRIDSCFFISDLEQNLTRFWEIEECPPYTNKKSNECEQHYIEHHKRLPDGRYCVSLPFKGNERHLGNSYNTANKRFQTLKQKFQNNSELKAQYMAVMNEYLDLGHMSPVLNDDIYETKFYLPHHAVFKPGSLTTAIRVVFDGSAKTTSGISLNETLLVGPTIQSELFALLLRFRKHRVVITGDIEKMYRQFIVKQEDRKYQRILWFDENGKDQVYELNTITFGLSCAPYLAIRCLHQLAEDEQKTYPIAAEILKTDLYVDDLLTGADTIQEAIQIRKQLTDLLLAGQLKIRQWASNCPDVLKGLPHNSINKQLTLNDCKTIKTLGIKWDSENDTFVYNVCLSSTTVTKRTILADIAKIFDPIGLLAPIIVTAKIILQKLWVSKVNWDESLPLSLHTEWVSYKNQLTDTNNFQIPRKVIIDNHVLIEFHGFSDASQQAYGACVYIRSTDEQGNVQVTLLCAKSKVAPLKSSTIPRLELCGALLLSQLITYCTEALKLKPNQVICWTDSTIVLHWLRTPSNNLKQFVCNRVKQIQNNENIRQWRHIRSYDNPADLISRGMSPSESDKMDLWIHGPKWLRNSEDEWPEPLITTEVHELPEIKGTQCFAIQKVDDFMNSILHRYSSINKLITTIAYCFRVMRKYRSTGPINLLERNRALQIVIKMVQRSTFTHELNCLMLEREIPQKSRLLQLRPFLDENGIIRVGGRLTHSVMPFSQKHPIILPKDHHITKILIEEEHKSHLHSGVQATLYALRRKYWILDGRNAVRKIIRSCITCCKLKPPSLEYVMGNLPAARITQARPFSRVGIDYCGPFYIKEKKTRNQRQIKIYVAVFVCLVVKAVHLEVVSDLTTNAFLAALRRFISRRGMCSDIFSDNGTNFVGANNKLRELGALLMNNTHQKTINEFLTQRNIKWHFIPVKTPNFGGLWEAAVKSFKHHLFRTVGKTLLTFEEFNTFIIEIEAVLNSRPLTPISSDPNDLLVLTPGHFLIGDCLTSLPGHDYTDTQRNRLNRWEHIQYMRQHFWKRWSREYLNELTIRHKWTKHQPMIQKGTVVLLKEDNLPPLQWVMGRVIQLHPGSDGITRVVRIKTSQGECERSIRKLAPLPIELKEDDYRKNFI